MKEFQVCIWKTQHTTFFIADNGFKEPIQRININALITELAGTRITKNPV